MYIKYKINNENDIEKTFLKNPIKIHVNLEKKKLTHGRQLLKIKFLLSKMFLWPTYFVDSKKK